MLSLLGPALVRMRSLRLSVQVAWAKSTAPATLALNREVAIKVSAERFSDRFEREAHSIAALNHANICTLYDVGPNYLVMELVGGPTLARQIKEGPVALAEALTIARQVADALEAAREKGDHSSGSKTRRHESDAGRRRVRCWFSDLRKWPRRTRRRETQKVSHPLARTRYESGVILGTAAYMGPGQASGKRVDKRARISGPLAWCCGSCSPAVACLKARQ